MLRRLTQILLTSVVTVLALCLAGWGYIYTHQSQVAATISKQLSERLNTPVTVERPILGLHPTPTLDIENIQLDMSDKNLTVHIKKLQIGFSWQSIFMGTLRMAQLDVIEPVIDWTVATTEHGQTNNDNSLESINAISELLGQVRIVNGSLQLHNVPDNDKQAAKRSWAFQHLNVTINNRALNQNREVILNGQLLQNQHAPAPFSVRVQLSKIASQWSDTQIQLRSVVENIRTSQLLEQSKYQANGPLTVHLDLNGNIHSGLTIHSSITPSNNKPLLIEGGGVKQPLQYVNLNTMLRYSKNALQLNNIDLSYNGLAIAGDLTFNDLETEATIYANLRSDEINLKQAQWWLPETFVKQIPAFSQHTIIKCQKLIIDGPVKTLSFENILEARIIANQPELSIQGITGENIVATLHWEDGQGEISTSLLSYDYKRIHAQGSLKLKVSHNSNNSWILSSDLSSWVIDLAGALRKKEGQTGTLTFEFKPTTSTKHIADISNGQVQLPGYNILFSGRHDKDGQIQFDVDLPNYQLETISNEIPILKRMELKGDIALEYHLEKKPGLPATGTGEVKLYDCAISPTYTISPIHHINGTVSLKDLSAQAPSLSFILGDSPMTADAYIHDLSHPVAEIHAKGDGVIAQDLVFNSPTILLNNLDGRIAIHAKGIDFIDASVDLEQGTHATVNGTLIFKKPLLELNIEAPYANINEIIALWSDPNSKDKHPPTHNKKRIIDEFIHINAHVEEGIISGFEFQQARGTIHYKTGQLRVEPLHFQADKGTGKGSVYVIRRQEPATSSLLKITGTLSNINADKVYKQLFKHVGLVTGTLNGNFTIHGPIGSEFLEHSQGDFHLNIQHGVLRQFKTLSKAFSILNIAQLFALKLPDMDSEGMPFKDLSSDITLNNGVLHSENLVINSSSMGISVIGNHNLVNQQLDLIMGIKPLATVDTLVKHIPIAGWILAGEEQAVITTHFNVSGSASDPIVEMLPLSSISKKVFNIFKRTLKLPGTLITDPKKILINPKD